MNLSIHQYRVTPLRNSSEFHLRAGPGTRHDLFLTSLYPLRHPTRKVDPVALHLCLHCGATESP